MRFRFPVQVYLFGMQCGLNNEPALCAVSVFHLQYVVSQVFPSHFHEALLALHIQLVRYYSELPRFIFGLKSNTCICVVKQTCTGNIYLIVDGNRAQAVKKEQQGGVHVMEQVSGLMTLGAQRKVDLSGPAVRDKQK